MVLFFRYSVHDCYHRDIYHIISFRSLFTIGNCGSSMTKWNLSICLPDFIRLTGTRIRIPITCSKPDFRVITPQAIDMDNVNVQAQTPQKSTSFTTSPVMSSEEILQDLTRVLNRAGEDFSMHRSWLPVPTYQSLNVEYARLRSQASVVALYNSSRNSAVRLQKAVYAFEQTVYDEICRARNS